MEGQLPHLAGVVSTDLAGGSFPVPVSARPIHPFSTCSAVSSRRLRPRTRFRPQFPHEHGASYPTPTRAASTQKRDMFGQRARSPTSWAIRSVPRVFAEGPSLRHTERRTLTRTRTQNHNRTIISARVHGPVTPLPQQSLITIQETRVSRPPDPLRQWQSVSA